MSLKWPSKDPDETLDYTVDWSRFLRPSETISTVLWYVEDADGVKQELLPSTTVDSLTVTQTGNTTTTATIVLSGGTNNRQYKVFCNVTTSRGITAERSIILGIKER